MLQLPQRRRAAARRSAARLRTPTSRGSTGPSAARRKGARSPSPATACSIVPAQCRARRSTCRDRRRAVLAAAERAQHRVARLVVGTRRRPAAPTAAAQAMGITGLVSSFETFYGGIAEPDPQRPARRASRRRQADRAGRDLLLQPGDRRADGGERLPRGAGDHQRRALDRARRRRVPGLDDRLQRRVRGRAADHVAHESRALHLALPARPRRDRQLPRRRPQVRQRHRSTGCCCGRSSARRRSSSRSTARRSTAASSPRRRRCASSRRRPSRRRSTSRSSPGERVVDDSGEPRSRPRCAACVYAAGREAALRRDLVLELPRLAEDRPHRAEEAQAEAEASRRRRCRTTPTAATAPPHR